MKNEKKNNYKKIKHVSVAELHRSRMGSPCVLRMLFLLSRLKSSGPQKRTSGERRRRGMELTGEAAAAVRQSESSAVGWPGCAGK